jgi:hypothetical protein
MTTRITVTPEHVADCAQVLEHLLPPGYSLAHTRGRWYLKSWDSWIQHGQPRMGWRDVDSSRDLVTLLSRLKVQ